MAILFSQFRTRILALVPLILLFATSLTGNSIFDLNFFSINVAYILIYFWVLRKPDALGYGFIFLSGIITDVVYGIPIGSTSLSLLFIAGAAAYVRVLTVRISLLNDWISFIPALLLANFVYFLALYFSNYNLDYVYLFKSSIFTFIFYPIFWGAFSVLLNLTKS